MRNKSIYEWLSHPLLLLLVGALVSSYLLPLLTQSWQNHQKELELKSTLVSQISEEATDFIMAVQFAEMRATSQSQEDFDAAYRQWEIVSARMGALVSAYFPRTSISDDWSGFSATLTDFYALTGANDPVSRQFLLDRLRAAAGGDAETVDWAALVERSPGSAFSENWMALRQQLFDRRDAIIQAILDARITAL